MSGYRSALRQLAADLGYSMLVRACCWDCGEDVYLLAKPDGGFVILDDKGPDWPIHPCYQAGRSSGGGGGRSSRPSLFSCRPDYQVPVPAGVYESRGLRDGQTLRATIVAVEGRDIVVCDGEHLYRVAVRGPGRLGECIEGVVHRQGAHWELRVTRVVCPEGQG